MCEEMAKSRARRAGRLVELDRSLFECDKYRDTRE
jgi:hypothetical protein